jgi:ribosomal protein L29
MATATKNNVETVKHSGFEPIQEVAQEVSNPIAEWQKQQFGQHIVVSKSAYRDLLLLKKSLDFNNVELVRFPDSDTKNQSIQELMKKGIIKKEGSRGSALYGMLVSLDQVEESQRKTKEMHSRVPRGMRREPVDLRKKLPPFELILSFFEAVKEELKDLSQDRHKELTERIQDLKKSLANLDGEAEVKGIETLSKLNQDRKNLQSILILEAARNVADEERFKGVDWQQLMSFDAKEA